MNGARLIKTVPARYLKRAGEEWKPHAGNHGKAERPRSRPAGGRSSCIPFIRMI